jgi:DNA-directed RNA polymerase subunit RPC12/RpoP
MTESTRHPQGARILAACWLAVLSWGELVVVVVLLLLGLVTKRAELNTVFVLTIGLLVSTVALYVLTALPLRCTHCGRRFLLETMGAKAARARKRGSLDYWATAVIDGILLRRVTCMYCGTEHRVG